MPAMRHYYAITNTGWMALLNSPFVRECAIPPSRIATISWWLISPSDTGSVPAVVPACLYRLIHGKTLPEPLSVQSDMDVSLEVDNRLLRYHPMLEGILLSECMRLGQRSFANKLISLFNQFNNPELRPKLM